MDLKVDIIVPLQQHSYRTARGLIKRHNLNRYYTSVYNNNKGVYKVLGLILPSSIKKRMYAKNEIELTPYVKCYSQALGLLFLFVLRIQTLAFMYHHLREELVNRCGTKSAKESCKEGKHIIWSYDTMSLAAFKYAKNHGATCVLEMASTTVEAIKQIVESEYKKQRPFSYTLKRHLRLYPERKCRQLSEEIRLADYIVVASTYVKSCLVAEGCPSEKIRLIPLGIDASKFNAKRLYDNNRRIRFLFVGRLESAKGIDYVFEVFKQLQDKDVELICVGEYYGEKSKYESYSNNIKLLGLRRPDEMPDIYKQADVYILPSLWEGFSFSLLEAMATGLPVIASKYSFAPDIIEDFEQGFVIDPRDINAFKEAIIWFLNNRHSMKYMGTAARERVLDVSWDSYYNSVNSLIDEINTKK